MASKLELIDDLLQRLDGLKPRDETQLDALRRRAEMVIRNVFGDASKYINDLEDIGFYPMVIPATPEWERESWNSGVEQTRNLFNTMKEELLLFEATTEENQAQLDVETQSNRVFVVHGHDDLMKQSVARTLEKFGLKPVILHEQPNVGSRTIIEKFADYSNVSFAVVLLSPDDVGRSRNAAPEENKYRARQNVILELGYFLGKLGRERVVALYRPGDDFEMPSDYSGVLYTLFDDAERWQFELVRELQASGYDIDANKLTRR